MCDAAANAAAAAADLYTTLLRLVLPLAAQEVHLCPQSPPVDHFNIVTIKST